MLELIKTYAKKYYWLAIVALIVIFANTIGGMGHDFLAYRNPSVKMVVVTKVITKVIEKRDIVTVKEVERRPDGTEIERTRIEDKSLFDRDTATDTASESDTKPVLASSRLLSHRIGLSTDFRYSEPRASYRLRHRNVSGGFDFDISEKALTSLTEFQSGVRMTLDFEF